MLDLVTNAFRHRRGRLLALVVLGNLAAVTLAMGSPQSPAEGSPAAAPAAPPAYAQDTVGTCLRKCHNTAPAILILQTPHAVKADARTPFAQHQCETCHGASPEHVAVSSNPVGGGLQGPEDSHRSPSATRCASPVTSRACATHWTGSQHETRGVACNDCHNIHATEQKVLNKATQAEVCFTCHKEQRAQTRRISTHPLAVTGLASTAKMACSDCHNPHGSTGPTLLVKNSVNETCYTCHAEKRGPFLWEHAPVVDNCINCHTPHGSTNAPLLKTRAPWLCQECHSGDHGNQVNSGANLAGGNVTTINGAPAAGRGRPASSDGRPCLPELPRADPWFESSGRREVPALTRFSQGRVMNTNANGSAARASVAAVRGALIAMALAACADHRGRARRAEELPRPTGTVEVGVGDVSRRLVQGRRIQRARRRRAPSSSATFDLRGGAVLRQRRARCAGASRAPISAWRRAACPPRSACRASSASTFGYDELRRNRSDSYQTPYHGTGTNILTLPGTWLVPTVAGSGGTNPDQRERPRPGDWRRAVHQHGRRPTIGALVDADRGAEAPWSTPRPTADLPLFHNVNLFTKRTRYDAGFNFNFGPRWGFDASFRPEHKDGMKPMGTVSRNTGGDISTIIPDLIDTNTNQIDVSLNFKGKKSFAQAAYYGSFFTNNVPSMSWQNWATARRAPDRQHDEQRARATTSTSSGRRAASTSRPPPSWSPTDRTRATRRTTRS